MRLPSLRSTSRALLGPRTLRLAVAMLAAATLAACTDGGGHAEPDGGPDRLVTLAIDPRSIHLTEGTSTTFSLALDQPMAIPVTVRLEVPPGLTVEPASVAVGIGRRVVTVRAPDDADTTDGALTLSLTGDGVEPATVQVTVRDDDGGPSRLVIDPSSLSIREGRNDSFTVKLAAQPTTTTIVSLASRHPYVARAEVPSLTFTSTDWNVAQPVKVTAVDDANRDSATTSIGVVATIDGVRVETSVSIAVSDDDGLGLILSRDRVVTVEGGSGDTTVQLSDAPTVPLTVKLRSAAPGVATVSPTELTFDRLNWNQPQKVTIAGTRDVNTTKDTTTVELVGDGVTGTISVEILDAGPIRIVTDPDALRIDEGDTKTAAVRLSAPPAAEVKVTVRAPPGIASVTPSELVFTTDDWDQPQSITVSTTHDGDVSDAKTFIALTAPAEAQAAFMNVTVVDDGDLELVLTATDLSLEEGKHTSFSVSLKERPAVDTVVNLASSDETAVALGASELVFSSSDFATPQRVRVYAEDDDDLDDEDVIVSLSAGGVVRSRVAVAVTDGDSGGIYVTRRAFSVREQGDTEDVGVSLREAPSHDVTVSIAITGSDAVVASRSTLTFTPTSWNTDQIVTLTANHDDNADDEKVDVTLSAPGYVSRVVKVTTREDDEVTLVTSAADVTVAEGASIPVTVRLSYRPKADTVIAVKSSKPEIATVSPTTLTFTRDDWHVDQTVTLHGERDADDRRSTTAIILDGPGSANARIAIHVTEGP